MTEPGQSYSPLEGIGAVRLAVEAGADDRARVRVLREILKRLPEPEKGDTGSVKLLLEAVRSVRQEAIDVLRTEGNRQADEWMRAAVEAWDECDVSDFEDIKDVQFKLGCAADAVSALVALAPVVTEEDEVSDA